MKAGLVSYTQYEYLAVAINTGTNLPSVATQTASGIPVPADVRTGTLIRLSYGKMVIMALPYTIVMTLVGSSVR